METQEHATEKPNVPILMLGLDEAGKTTLLYKLKLGDGSDLKIIPTIGYNVETVEFEDKNYTFWDIGGRNTVRVLWKFYAENKAAIVFVVDASNPERFDEANDFLRTILAHKVLENVNLLLVLNKRDTLAGFNYEELKEKLNLENVKQAIRVVYTSAFDSGSLENIMIQLKEINKVF